MTGSSVKAFVQGKDIENYSYPEGCPFDSSRAGKTRALLDSIGMLTGGDKIEVNPEAAGRDILELYHTPIYLDTLYSASRGNFDHSMLMMGLGTDDCPVFRGMYEYADLAAGATVAAANMILNGDIKHAFCPSGGYHHAHSDSASGFCYINDIVLGCMVMAGAGRKVLFIDIDVHHTDGVQDAFYDRSDVMTISMHQDGRTLFPGTGSVEDTGTGPGRGYSVNIPLPMSTYDAAYMNAFRHIVLPLIHSYSPDVIVLEIGADGLAGDPLANLSLTNNTYADVIELLLAFGKPILATGGGGYNVENTVRAWALSWTVLTGDDPGQDAMAGLGGVMLESTDWHGGLRDRVLAPDNAVCKAVDEQMDLIIDQVKKAVFPLHNINF